MLKRGFSLSTIPILCNAMNKEGGNIQVDEFDISFDLRKINFEEDFLFIQPIRTVRFY